MATSSGVVNHDATRSTVGSEFVLTMWIGATMRAVASWSSATTSVYSSSSSSCGAAVYTTAPRADATSSGRAAKVSRRPSSSRWNWCTWYGGRVRRVNATPWKGVLGGCRVSEPRRTDTETLRSPRGFSSTSTSLATTPASSALRPSGTLNDMAPPSEPAMDATTGASFTGVTRTRTEPVSKPAVATPLLLTSRTVAVSVSHPFQLRAPAYTSAASAVFTSSWMPRSTRSGVPEPATASCVGSTSSATLNRP